MMKSLGAMVSQLELLIGGSEFTASEADFVSNIAALSAHGKDVGKLSINQIERMIELYQKHFADAEPA